MNTTPAHHIVVDLSSAPNCNIPLAAGGSTWSGTTGPAKQDKLVKSYIIVAIIFTAKSKALIRD